MSAKTTAKPKLAAKMKPQTPRVPITTLTLGGRERTLRIDFNALAAAEDARGVNYMSGNAFAELSFGDVRALVYGCLLHEDPNLTPDQVGRWLRVDQMAEIGAALAQMFAAFMPGDEDTDAGPLGEDGGAE